MNESTTNGSKPEETIVKEPSFFYLPLLSGEIVTLRPLMRDYFKEIKAPKEAQDERLNKHIQIFDQIIAFNAFAQFVAAYTEKPDYPLNIEGEAVGYIYFYIDKNLHEERRLFIDQLYVNQDQRQNISLVKTLPSIACEFAKRAKVQKVECEARTADMQNHWISYGFKVESSRLTFEGTIADFENYKLTKATKSIRNSEGGIWEQNKARSPNPLQEPKPY